MVRSHIYPWLRPYLGADNHLVSGNGHGWYHSDACASSAAPSSRVRVIVAPTNADACPRPPRAHRAPPRARRRDAAHLTRHCPKIPLVGTTCPNPLLAASQLLVERDDAPRNCRPSGPDGAGGRTAGVANCAFA